MTVTYRYFSADSHLEIDSKWWLPRVPAEYRDQAPKVIRLPDGSDAWLVEGQSMRQIPFDLTGERDATFGSRMVRTTRQRPGLVPPEQRFKEQDNDGIDGEVLFPRGGRPVFWRSIRDDDAYKAASELQRLHRRGLLPGRS